MRIIYSFSLISLLFSCVTSKTTLPETNSSQNEKHSTFKITATLGQKQEAQESYTIQQVEIVDNNMVIGLRYSGSCDVIDFKMIGLELNPTTTLPIRQLQIYQPRIKDPCIKDRQITLEVDISAVLVSSEKGSVNYFLLNGWANRIEYVVK